MSNKVKRKVTVENTKDNDEHPRRPSVFERLGPNAVNIAAQPADRHNRTDPNEKCRNWLRTGACAYGNTCRYQHDPFPGSSRRPPKPEKDPNEKDLRHKVRTKRDEPKESRTGSISPKRKGSKRSNSRSRKGEHESKIKSTVVVTRPRSPSAPNPIPEVPEAKKKSDGNWEDDSDDWPMDAAQLDYKEELTLERKRQQLQRELELELQREKLLNESVTVTKTKKALNLKNVTQVSFSESSSTSSSSDSGSISSSTGSTSSSSGEDSDDSSSSSSSSSSSGSRHPTKRKSKKSVKSSEKSSDFKQKDDYDKIKSSRAAKAQKIRTPSPNHEGRKKGRDKRIASPMSPKRRGAEAKSGNVRARGPRTPSPINPSRKQRIWGQSSSADSRSAELQRGRGKRHKKKKDASKNDRYKTERIPTPPPLSSPNRTALMPPIASKKSKRDEPGGKSRHRGRESPPMLLPRNTAPNIQPIKLVGNSARYLPEDKSGDRHRYNDRPKAYSRKEDDALSLSKRTDSRDRTGKRSKLSPRKDTHKVSLSPHKDRYDQDVISNVSRKIYGSPIPPHEKEDRGSDRRRLSLSPGRNDRRKLTSEVGKKRDVREISPRQDSRRETQYRATESHGYEKRGLETKVKRVVSPDLKKGREDRIRDHNQKDRNVDYEGGSWLDHRKPSSLSGRRSPEQRGRQEIHSQSSGSRNDPSRERDSDRKKRKDKDIPPRAVDNSDRARLSPRRSQSPMHGHHGVREIESLTGNRGRMYDADIPPSEREYAYGYDPLHDPYINDRLPSEYESDVLRGPPMYSSDVYSDSRYRRDIKDPALIDRYGPREVLSPQDMLPHRDIISLTGRNDDYLTDMPLDERGYEERWSRGRGREDWDSYSTIPSTPLPPHVAAALDEDRYGMPRRRRASPEWQRGRIDDRDTGLAPMSHRQGGRGQLPPREARSRSPPKGTGSNRGSWSGRHERNIDNRNEDSQKSLDDRKGRNNRKDRVKRKDESSNDNKSVSSSKESKDRPSGKRPHSPSPSLKDAKRRKEDVHTPESVVSSEKGSSSSYKRSKEDSRDHKSSNSRQKSGKLEVSSPKSDVSHHSGLPAEKVESVVRSTNDGKNKEKDDRKVRRNEDSARGEDDFSDWSDGDDDLLNRDDFMETEGNSSVKSQHKSVDKNNDDSLYASSKRKDKTSKDRPQESKKIKEMSSRTSSKDRSNEDFQLKENKSSTEMKDLDAQETFSLKEDTDVEEYITAESVDYDPISDDELDALIEEPDDSLIKQLNETEKSKIVDALDVNWSALMSETKTEFVPGFARRRFKAAHVLSRIGFSQVFAGPELSEKIVNLCQKQLSEEDNQNEGEANGNKDKKPEKKFVLEHQLAAFHVAISQTKRERTNAFNNVGPYRRALCARRDLQIRKQLCKPINKFTKNATVSYTPQYNVVDKDLYKRSLELLRRKTSEQHQPQTINVC
ncbi:zinc finger CCCH domain-containing protein 13-like isoform X2 [Uloborus diversus]|uniref:zinc finger CCCH domain-containing protein 13-like isoform X2 n=1 Tax=Uloborus diversus TaxID=327109 RepID=UPI00240A1BA1|nr:zinc finger CCCH domain-containing protein 13-like isoform X2 [Uloborus diversus]